MRFILLAIVLFGMNSAVVEAASTLNDGKTPTANIISFKNDFSTFWKKAQGKIENEQLQAWDQLIETPHQLFFDSVVWEKNQRSDWRAFKIRTLTSRLKEYPFHFSKIMDAFTTFPSIADRQIGRITKALPFIDVDFPIYGVVAPDFDAKSGVLEMDGAKAVVLTFALDSFSIENGNYDIVFPHELFHAYHAKHEGFLNDGVMAGVSLTIPLWEEGLATYISSVLNPTVDDGALLLSPELGKVSKTDQKWLAKEFLEHAVNRKVDLKNPEMLKRWFNIGMARPRADLPNRCGYLLGLTVVRELAKKYGLQEMINWNINQASEQVVGALQELLE